MTVTSVCFFRRFDESPCLGRLDPCHLIPAQRIKQAGLEQFALDPRIIRPGCRHHHDRFDARDAMHPIRLRYRDYPESVVEWAIEHGFFWVDARTGWLPIQDAG